MAPLLLDLGTLRQDGPEIKCFFVPTSLSWRRTATYILAVEQLSERESVFLFELCWVCGNLVEVS